MQDSCELLKLCFYAEHDDDWIEESLGIAWFKVNDAIKRNGDSNLRDVLETNPNSMLISCPGVMESENSLGR